MEAAAIAQVCASAPVPFLSVKDISNNELLRGTTSGQAMLEEVGVQQLPRRAVHTRHPRCHNAFVIWPVRTVSNTNTLAEADRPAPRLVLQRAPPEPES